MNPRTMLKLLENIKKNGVRVGHVEILFRGERRRDENAVVHGVNGLKFDGNKLAKN